MTNLKIIKDANDIKLDQRWGDAVKFKNKNKIIYSNGHSYQLIAKKERLFSCGERFARGLLGVPLVLFSFGGALRSKTVCGLFTKKFKRVRFATVFTYSPQPGENGSKAPSSPQLGENGSKAPSSPQPGENGSKAPSSPQQGENGSKAPSSPQPGENGSKAPSSPQQGENGSKAPSSPQPGENGSKAPSSPQQGENGSKAPSSPQQGENGSKAPSSPQQGENGSKAPSSPQPGENGSKAPSSPQQGQNVSNSLSDEKPVQTNPKVELHFKANICILNLLVGGVLGTPDQRDLVPEFLEKLTGENGEPIDLNPETYFIEVESDAFGELEFDMFSGPVYLPYDLLKDKKHGDTVRLKYDRKLIEFTIDQDDFNERIKVLGIGQKKDKPIFCTDPFWWVKLPGTVYQFKQAGRDFSDLERNDLLEPCANFKKPKLVAMDVVVKDGQAHFILDFPGLCSKGCPNCTKREIYYLLWKEG